MRPIWCIVFIFHDCRNEELQRDLADCRNDVQMKEDEIERSGSEMKNKVGIVCLAHHSIIF